MKALLLIILLGISNLITAQKICNVYQYTSTSDDTTIGLQIIYDSIGNIKIEKYTNYQIEPNGTINDNVKIYFYSNIKLDSTKQYFNNSDSVIVRFEYNEKNKISKKIVMNYKQVHKQYYKKNPEWGKEETYYTYSDSLLLKEETFGFYGDGSKVKKLNTKIYKYNNLKCEIIETRHDYQFFNPYRKKIKTIKYQNNDYRLILYAKEINNKNELIEEVEYIYDNLNQIQTIIKTDGITLEKLWSKYVYSIQQ